MQEKRRIAKSTSLKTFLKKSYYQKIRPNVHSLKNNLGVILKDFQKWFPKRKAKPRKLLITRTGRFIEKLSFTAVGLSILILIASCAAFARFYGVKVGDEVVNPDWYDSIYFSVITFTSLGYGDIAPTGLGKLVAMTEVIIGLALVAIFIGKIASERQSALLLLLYTSEQQQRIVKFVTDLSDLQNSLNETLESKTNHNTHELAISAYHFTSSICSYLIVQAHQGDIAAFGNISSLRKLYQIFGQLQSTAFKGLYKYGLAPETVKVLGNIIGVLSGNAKRMIDFHRKDQPGQVLLRKMIKNGDNLVKYNQDIESGKLVIYSHTHLTDELLSRVRSFVDGKPKIRDFHKELAKSFGIPNNLANNCLKIITEEQKNDHPQL